MRSWQADWELAPDIKIKSGAQANSFAVRHRTQGHLGLVKEVRRARRKSRLRFAREVRIYETLVDAGLPALYEHNADEVDSGNPLYLVIEFIPGGTLQAFVDRNGPSPFGDVLEFTRRVGEVLGALHAEEMAHRDLKPANVVLRDGEFGSPVVVDFGLSFIDDDADLTTTNETVGNRFLNLPEQAHGSRSAGSDVTQLAGIVFFALTGLYPLSLDDGEGHKPHQTTSGRSRLAAVPDIDDSQFRRLLSLFDKAFAMAVLDRYQSVGEFIAAMERIAAPGQPPSDREAMLDVIRSRWLAAGGDRRNEVKEALHKALGVVKGVINDIEQQTGVPATRMANHIGADGPIPYMSARMGLAGDGGETRFRDYRVELRGAGEYVLLVDGDDTWRGTDVEDPQLAELVAVAMMAPLLD